jgi:hypothetical protein
MECIMTRLLPAGLLCLLSAACAPTIHEVQDYQTMFLCEDGQNAQLRFTPFQAVLEFQGISVTMAQQPIADGFLYAGGGQSLSQRGYDVTWTDDKGVIRHCRDPNAPRPKGDTAGR